MGKRLLFLSLTLHDGSQHLEDDGDHVTLSTSCDVELFPK